MKTGFFRRRTVRSVLALGVVACAAAGGFAYASVQDTAVVIHGCVATKGGGLRVLTSGQSCKKDETPLDWNQTGPTGATGQTGATGATGATGPTGASGSLSSFDELQGADCTRQSVPGSISITYAADGTVTLKCVLPAGYTALAAAANAGDTNIKVVSVSGMVVGLTLTIDVDGANPETVTITTVGTSGAAGTGVTFSPALAFAHPSGALVHKN